MRSPSSRPRTSGGSRHGTAVVVVLRAGQTVTETELIDHARTTLAPFKLPKAIHFVDELPRNQSGKLLKRVLRDDLAQQPATR